MKNKIFGFLACLMLTISVFSCATEDDAVGTTENFVNDSTDKICTETRSGDKGCFELIFPITVVFSDASTVAVNSFEEMKSAFKTWKEANPSVKGRPTIQFPYSVTTQDGSIVTIENAEQLKALLATCITKGDGPGKGGGHDGGGPKGDGNPCFKINFPFTVITTSKGEVVINSQDEFQALLKSLKGTKEKPQYVYPITLTLKDGTVVTVKSAEEIKAIKDGCRKG